MEINGITFKDYACAMANQAGGMSDEKICEVFGMEQPVWEDTKNQWVSKMAEMSHDDMNFYGEVFMNPKQGKFANVEGGQEGPEKVLEKYPKWSHHIKMQQHFAIADDVGIHIDFQKEYGISITESAQLGMYWGGIYRDALFGDDEGEKQKISKKHDKLNKKWKKHFKAMYKDQDSGIGDDIDF